MVVGFPPTILPSSIGTLGLGGPANEPSHQVNYNIIIPLVNLPRAADTRAMKMIEHFMSTD